MFQRTSTFVMNLDKGWKFMGGRESPSSPINIPITPHLGTALYSDSPTSPPTDLADRLSESIPQLLKENGLTQRSTKAAMENDKCVPLPPVRREGVVCVVCCVLTG